MNTTVQFTPKASLAEAANIIEVVGDTSTCILLGEPGIGKTQILKTLEERLGDGYDYIYVDCPLKELMDIGANIPNHDDRALTYYVAGLFNLSGPGANRPKVIMLDEVFKTDKMMRKIFTRLILERYVGDKRLPDGSIVFGTSNNVTDGVGDVLEGHVGSRVMIVPLRKSNATEYNSWAGKHKVSPLTRSWVALNPRSMHSYTDAGQEDNPYIFNPRKNNKQYVCPRSITKADFAVIQRKDRFSENEMMVALIGMIGESAARSMMAFVQVQHKMVKYEDVLANPKTVTVPEDIAVQLMMMMEAVDKLNTQDELSAYMEFVNRVKSSEIQAIFFTMMSKDRMKLARYNQQINEWSHKNFELI
jgi:hypothetical protein